MLEAKYGLPPTVMFCKRCVISNQRPSSVSEYRNVGQDKPTIHFDEEGVCDACRTAERKGAIDWGERERLLRELCDRFRDRTRPYDCVAPGSGGKDSFYAAHVLKTRFDMRPLTVTWRPHLYTAWGFANHARWIDAGFDNYLVSPNGKIHRLLTRLAVENLFHPFQPFIIGQKGLAPKLAAQFGIPLVFFGEDEAEYGNPIQDSQTPTRDASYHTSDDVHLSGVSLRDLRSQYGLTLGDLEPYIPASAEKLSGVEVHYLGYYLKWGPQECYYYAQEHGGFESAPERSPGSYSRYNSIDDKLDDLHYWTTYQKFGIGRATYDAAQEIRNAHLTREDGVALVKRFDGEYPERFEREVFDYLSVDGFVPFTRERLFMLAEKFRSPHLWDGDTLRYRVWDSE